MKVFPINGEPTRFHVLGSNGIRYLVDLASWSGNGQCGCPHFEYRLEPKLRLGAEPGREMRCKHLAAARDYALDLTLRQHKNLAKRNTT